MKTPKLHATQMEYAKQKAIVDALRKRMATEAPKAPERGAGEAAIDAWVDAHEDYLAQIGYYPAIDALAKAENAMIEWAKNVMQTHPKFASRFGEIAIVFEKAPRSPKFRDKLVEMTFKLAAA